MKKELGKKMKDVYDLQFEEHGYSPASLGCAKGRQDLRFKALSAFLEEGSVLDFGCGFGDLAGFLDKQKNLSDYAMRHEAISLEKKYGPFNLILSKFILFKKYDKIIIEETGAIKTEVLQGNVNANELLLIKY